MEEYKVDLAKAKFPMNIEYKTSKEIREKLANRFEFDTISSLHGNFTVEKKDNLFVLEGTYHATATVSGKSQTKDEEIRVVLVPEKDQEKEFSIDEDIEILEDNKFDLGEIIAQYLFLDFFDLLPLEKEDREALVDLVVNDLTSKL